MAGLKIVEIQTTIAASPSRKKTSNDHIREDVDIPFGYFPDRVAVAWAFKYGVPFFVIFSYGIWQLFL